VLIKHDWNVADATVLLSTQSSLKAMTSENKVRAKAAASLHKHKGEQFVSYYMRLGMTFWVDYLSDIENLRVLNIK